MTHRRSTHTYTWQEILLVFVAALSMLFLIGSPSPAEADTNGMTTASDAIPSQHALFPIDHIT